MTHPIVEAVAERIAALLQDGPLLVMDFHRTDAADIVAEVLRLAREPSEAMTIAMFNRDLSVQTFENEEVGWGVKTCYRAGIDALLREVER